MIELIQDLTTIDNFALQQFLTCRRKFYWRIVESLVFQRVSLPRLFGIAIHEALAEMYTSYDLAKTFVAFNESWEQVGEEDDIRNTKTGENLLTLYIKEWAPEWFTVIEAEVGFALELSQEESILYSGRIDMFVQEKGSNRKYAVDHKTAAQKPSSIETKPRQLTGYIWALQQISDDSCYSAILNYLILTKVPKFKRVLSTRTPGSIEEWRQETIRIVRDIRECRTIEDFYCDREQCTQYRGCDYLELCNVPTALQSAIIEHKYAREPWKAYQLEKEAISVNQG